MKNLICAVVLSCGCTSHFQALPLKLPFAPLEEPPLRAGPISESIVAEIVDGDFTNPRFSPDGKVLAYANVLVRGRTETTEVRLFDLSTKQTTMILGEAVASNYMTYAAFVARIEWASDRHVAIYVSDGDVGVTELIFDIETRRLISEKSGDVEEEAFQAPPVPSEYQSLRDRVTPLLPDLPARVVDNIFDQETFVRMDGGLLFQKKYSRHDSDVWLLDLETGSIRRVLHLSRWRRAMLAGGVEVGESTIFFVSTPWKGYLYEYRKGRIRRLAQLDTSAGGRPFLFVKHRTAERAIFMVQGLLTL